jgi:hypothetical protein
MKTEEHFDNRLPINTAVAVVTEGDPLKLKYLGTITAYDTDGCALVNCPGVGEVRAASVEPLKGCGHE